MRKVCICAATLVLIAAFALSPDAQAAKANIGIQEEALIIDTDTTMDLATMTATQKNMVTKKAELKMAATASPYIATDVAGIIGASANQGTILAITQSTTFGRESGAQDRGAGDNIAHTIADGAILSAKNIALAKSPAVTVPLL